MHRLITAAIAASTLLFAFTTISNAENISHAGSNSNSNSSSGSYSGVSINNRAATKLKTTGNAIAPGLIAGGLSCAGSVSAGAGWLGGGFAFGTTKMDRDCNTRENAKIVGLTGDVPAAKEVMCTIPEVRDAYARVGRYCIGDSPADRRGAIIRARAKGHHGEYDTVSYNARSR